MLLHLCTHGLLMKLDKNQSSQWYRKHLTHTQADPFFFCQSAILSLNTALRMQNCGPTSCETDLVAECFSGSECRTTHTSITWTVSALGNGPEIVIDVSCQREPDTLKPPQKEKSIERKKNGKTSDESRVIRCRLKLSFVFG